MNSRFITTDDGRAAYVTADGDMVDHVALAYYGKHKGMSELIYAANRGLADRGVVLPAGVLIILPEVSKQLTPEPFIRLWD